jgi:hypothetical protein
MTEEEWLTCIDPEKALRFLRGKVSDRKLRLFACGCCRRAWSALAAERGRTAVEIAERYADGSAKMEELQRAWDQATATRRSYHWGMPNVDGILAALPEQMVGVFLSQIRHALAWQGMAVPFKGYKRVAKRVGVEAAGALRALLRDVFGNPFRPVTIPPAWLLWNGGTVPKLAEAIYEQRRFSDLPILADALEEAGCDSADILTHCRQPGEHVRGCWVIDLLLGKE